jgi:GT2 family glycosyltransferase
MKISILIPNYNGAKLLPSCLDSIKESLKKTNDQQPMTNNQVIVIDNGSTDNSLNLLKEKYPWVRVVSLEKNYGFAKAVNEGIKSSTGELILLINNDLQLKGDFFLCLSKNLEKISLSGHSFFATRVLNQTGTKIDSCGIEYEFYGKAFKRFNGLPANTPEALKESAVLGANGSCAIYKREFFEKLGLFEEDFHSYLEDVDLSLRAHFKGIKCLYLPNLVSYHQGEATSQQMGLYKAKQDFKNNIFLIINNYPPALILKNLFSIILERLRNLNGFRKEAVKHRGFLKGNLILLSVSIGVMAISIRKIFQRLQQRPQTA